MKNILFVFGTRPEVIKLAPVILELKKYPEKYNVIVCNTEQQKELSNQTLAYFGLKADILALRLVRQHLVHKPLVECQFSAIVGDLEHIIESGIHITVAYSLGTVCKGTHHFFLCLARFQHFVDVLRFRHRQVQHIRRLHVCRFLEQRNQFRQIKEPGKACFRAIARSLGLDFVKRFSVIFLNSSGCPQGSPL